MIIVIVIDKGKRELTSEGDIHERAAKEMRREIDTRRLREKRERHMRREIDMRRETDMAKTLLVCTDGSLSEHPF